MKEFKDSVTGKDDDGDAFGKPELDRGETASTPTSPAKTEPPVEAEPRS
jgi:hypothetical protein